MDKTMFLRRVPLALTVVIHAALVIAVVFLAFPVWLKWLIVISWPVTLVGCPIISWILYFKGK